MMAAALVGAAGASALFLAAGGTGGGRQGRSSTVTATAPGTAVAGRREVSSTKALTATQIYRQDAPGVVSIQATTAAGADSGTGIVLNDEG